MSKIDKKTVKETVKKCLMECGAYLAVFVVTLVLYLCVKPYINFQRNGIVAQSVTFGLLAVVGCVVAYMGMTKRLSPKKILVFMLIAGFLLRLGYVLYTAASARQYDTWTPYFDGHEAYAWNFFESGKLPDNNVYQFYHPPLNALVQSAFMHFLDGLSGVLSKIFPLGDYFQTRFLFGKPDYIDGFRYFLYSGCQMLGVLYSFMICVVSIKILSLFSLSEKTKLLLSAFVIFFPRGIQISGQLNNDLLAYLLAVLAIYYALKWHFSRNLVWIILCALSVGLGMMTKLSSATVCLPIAGIFIYDFVRVILSKNEAKIWKTVAQYMVFLFICAPLGLWFQIYAKIRFNQGFGYVFDNLNPALLTADKHWFARFFVTLDFSEYFGNLYCLPFENFNIFNYVVRSAIFGEFSYWQGEGFAFVAIVFAFISILCLLAGEIRCLVLCIKNRKNQEAQTDKRRVWEEVGFVGLFLLSQIGAFLFFNIKMPYGCTMDYRYIMPTSLALALAAGLVRDRLIKSGDGISVVVSRCMTISTGVFLIASALFYCVCI